MEHSCFVGIDVAKAHLDVHVRPTGETFAVGHDDAGLAALVDRVRPLAPDADRRWKPPAGYEATVAAILASAGLPVAVVNPRQIRDFARATGHLAKTDTLDARVIAHFAEAVRPRVRPLPTEQAQRLGRTRGPAPPARRDARGRSQPPPPDPGSRTATADRRPHRLARSGPSETSRRISTTRIRVSPVWRETEDLLTLGARGSGPSRPCTLIADLPELGRLDRRASPPWSASRRSIVTAAPSAAAA